jgi:hypothetical protein
MKLSTKKIVAREFIFLVIALLSFVVSYLSILIFNFFIQHKINGIKEKIFMVVSKTDSTTNLFNVKLEKQLRFTKTVFAETSNEEVPADILDELNESAWKTFYDYSNTKDSINYMWEHKWKDKLTTGIKNYGIKSPNDFKTFILNNYNSKNDSLHYEELLNRKNILKQQENENYEELISYDNQMNYSLRIALLILVLLFPIRYFSKAIKWSLFILKSKE